MDVAVPAHTDPQVPTTQVDVQQGTFQIQRTKNWGTRRTVPWGTFFLSIQIERTVQSIKNGLSECNILLSNILHYKLQINHTPDRFVFN